LEEEKKVVKINLEKEEFQPAEEGAAGPAGSARAFLKVKTNAATCLASLML
jgi:hypothetical protein